MEIGIQNLSKSFGKRKAIDDLTVELRVGIYGLLGPNGSGKTTFLRILAGNLKPDYGCVLYDGRNILEMGANYREKFGYMPQESGLYREFTVLRFMQYIAVLKGVNKKRAMSEIQEKLSLVNMWEHRFMKMPELSGGMRQRVMLAQALLANPEILLLDEPTAGVDPGERVQIRRIVSDIGKNRIVLISTHITTDISAVADRILVLKQGKLIANATQKDLLRGISGRMDAYGNAIEPSLEDYYLAVFSDKDGI